MFGQMMLMLESFVTYIAFVRSLAFKKSLSKFLFAFVRMPTNAYYLNARICVWLAIPAWRTLCHIGHTCRFPFPNPRAHHCRRQISAEFYVFYALVAPNHRTPNQAMTKILKF